MRNHELEVGRCVLCDYKTESRGMKTGKFQFKSASEVIYDRLWTHYELEHLDIIMPVWMNNQGEGGQPDDDTLFPEIKEVKSE